MSGTLFSAVIPTRNRAQYLGPLLDSLARQIPVGFEWEVVVVDNGSSDATREVVESRKISLSIPIRYVLEPLPGLHNGRHRGAREANGVFLGFLDDDMLVSPSWIGGVEMLKEKVADAVVGPILPIWEKKPPKWLLRLGSDEMFPYLGLLDLGPHRKTVDPLMVFGGNCFLPKELVFRLGGFHPDGMPPELISYRGDGETALMQSFRQAGLRSSYEPCAVTFHIISAERQTLHYLCKRAFNQGISDSFTHMRTNGAAHQEPSAVSVPHARPNEIPEALPRLTANGLRERLPFLRHSRTAIERRLNRAHEEGQLFHQSAVARDPYLLKWALKPSYLD
jgi:glucosyl-dolichyl phosphate glucuronosyltransferase